MWVEYQQYFLCFSRRMLTNCISGHVYMFRPAAICHNWPSLASSLPQAAALQLRKEENVQQSEKIINELESQIESLEQVLGDADARTFVRAF